MASTAFGVNRSPIIEVNVSEGDALSFTQIHWNDWTDLFRGLWNFFFYTTIPLSFCCGTVF